MPPSISTLTASDSAVEPSIEMPLHVRNSVPLHVTAQSTSARHVMFAPAQLSRPLHVMASPPPYRSPLHDWKPEHATLLLSTFAPKHARAPEHAVAPLPSHR